jgi:purine-binding chemotaxis protein CheW
MSAVNKEPTGGGDVRAGKYLTLILAGEEYGLPILKVQEIIGMMPITRVPRMPEFVRGVINLRGKVIQVIDLRLKFGIESRTDTETSCIIVVQVKSSGEQGITLGISVDEVSEVLNIDSDQIVDIPALGAGVDSGFMLGMGKVGDKVIMLLDLDSTFTDIISASA